MASQAGKDWRSVEEEVAVVAVAVGEKGMASLQALRGSIAVSTAVAVERVERAAVVVVVEEEEKVEFPSSSRGASAESVAVGRRAEVVRVAAMIGSGAGKGERGV